MSITPPRGKNLGPISLEELAAICKEPARRKGIHLIDLSPSQQFARGHIAYAFSVPLEEVEKKRESALPSDRVVVVYGPSAEEAEKGAELYVSLGFNVRIFKEGLEAWKKADLPVAG